MALAHALDWFDPFNRGLIPLGRLVQTAVAIYFLLGAAMVSVNARRWSTATVPFLGVVMTLLLFGYCAVCVILVLRETYRGPLLAPIGFVLLAAWGLAMVPRHLLLHAAAFVGLGVTLVNFGVQSDRAAVDWDTTGERLSSLSGASLDVLKQLKRPVKITAFISKDLPPKLALKGKEVENTLKVLDREMGEEVTLDLYRPENALDEAGSKATQFHGIMPRNEIRRR